MTNIIEIFFEDLMPDKQAEILAKMGNDGNYDTFPVAVIPIAQGE